MNNKSQVNTLSTCNENKEDSGQKYVNKLDVPQ